MTALGVLCVAAGFIVPLWPLSAAGLVLLALSGHQAWAIILGLFLDLAWGAPPWAPWMPLPFMLLAALAALGRVWGRKYLFDREPMKL
jgi:hypothetical protein